MRSNVDIGGYRPRDTAANRAGLIRRGRTALRRCVCVTQIER